MTMDVVLLGTGSPLPSPNRCGAGQVVIAGDTRVLIDCGWGVARRIFAAGMMPSMIDVLCFTHMHSDHITDTPDFMTMRWTTGATKPLTVYGPEGTRETMDGFVASLKRDVGYRLAHHGEKLSIDGARVEVHEIPATPDPTPVATIGDVAIEAFEVDHFPVVPALGFRVRRDGRSVVFSGDTTACASLQSASEGADMLVAEAMNIEMARAVVAQRRAAGMGTTAGLLEDAISYHSGTTAMARLASDAGVAHLVLSHIIPAVPNEGPLVEQFTAGMSELYAGRITVGTDLMRLTIE